MIVHAAIATVPAVAALALRWWRSGRRQSPEEASRICLLLIAAGLLGANAQVARWPVLLVHVGITVWIAWRPWPDGSGLAHWVLVWAFYFSPLFPQKGAAPVWVAALAAWLWWHVSATGMLPRGKGVLAGGLAPAWIVLVAAWIVSVAASPCPNPGAATLHMWAPAIVATVPLLWAAGRTERTRMQIVASWATAAALVGFVLFVGRVSGSGFEHWGPRAGPSHLHPNALGFWLVLGAAACVAWWPHAGNLPALCFLFSAAGALLTGSKASLAGLWFCLLAGVVTTGALRRRVALAALFVLIGSGGLVVRGGPLVGSVEDRVALLRAGVLCFLDRPWLGWGMGLNHLHLRFGWERIWQAPVLDWHTHNLLVQMAQATGILGVGALSALFVVAMRVGKGLYRLPLAMGALLGMADYLLHAGSELGALALAVALCAPLEARRQRRVAVGVAGAVLALGAVSAIPSVSSYCPLDPAEKLGVARRLWGTGFVDGSLDAYREAATMDPGEVRAVGVWEEGGLRSMNAGRSQQALAMLSRAVLVRPDIVQQSYWRTAYQGDDTAPSGSLSAVLHRAEEEARWTRARTEAGGVMLMWNLTRAYYLSGRTEDALRLFDEIADTPQMRRRMGQAEAWDQGQWAERAVYERLSQTRLTPGYFRAAFISHDMPESARAGRSVPVRLVIQNIGTGMWPEAGATRLGYDWFRSDGTQLTELAGRVLLPRDVPAGGSVELDLEIMVPGTPGAYRLVMDMLVETVAWFGSRGSRRLEILVEVR